MTITDYFTVCVVLYFITIDAFKENKETLLLKMNKNIVLFLPTLHSLVCIKVRHFGHGYEHSVFKERGEEIFWVVFGLGRANTAEIQVYGPIVGPGSRSIHSHPIS